MEQPKKSNTLTMALVGLVALLVGLGGGYLLADSMAKPAEEKTEKAVVEKNCDQEVAKQAMETKSYKNLAKLLYNGDDKELKDIRDGKTKGYKIMQISEKSSPDGMGGGYRLLYQNPDGEWKASAGGNGYPSCEEFTEEAKKAFFAKGNCTQDKIENDLDFVSKK